MRRGLAYPGWPRPSSATFRVAAAAANVGGRRVLVGNRRMMETEGIDLGWLGQRRDELAAAGRTAVLVAVDGKAAGVLALADTPRNGAAAAVSELHSMNIQVVMLTGDNQATARHIADQLGIDTVIAEVLPADKTATINELQRAGRRVAMVGDGVNDAPALAAADLGIAIGAGTDVAIETADVVLMRSDPLDVPTALRIGKGTLRKMRQNLGWAIGYNAIALPIAAGVFEPAFGLVLRPEIAALTMSGSSFLVAVNALLLKRLRLPAQADPAGSGYQTVQSPINADQAGPVSTLRTIRFSSGPMTRVVMSATAHASTVNNFTPRRRPCSPSFAARQPSPTVNRLTPDHREASGWELRTDATTSRMAVLAAAESASSSMSDSWVVAWATRCRLLVDSVAI